MANNTVDLTDVQIEPHGLRNVEFVHTDFRRRMLDRYGRCTKMASEVAAVETTCKAFAHLTGESDDIISIVYGINTLRVSVLTDLTVDSIDQCYMDAALDATKRLSVCTDIYYKNKDASTQHQDINADGETGGTGVGIVNVMFNGKNTIEYGEENLIGAIVLSGDVTGEIDVTLTPRNATITGLVSNKEQLINADMVYELPMHTLDAINTEISALKISPNSVGMSYLELRVNGNIAKTLTFIVVDNTQLAVTADLTDIYAGEVGSIPPIVFAGTMQSAVEITVEPTNCSISGFKSRPTLTVASGSTYSFMSDNITAINNELAALSVLANAIGSCQVKVTYPGGSKIMQYTVKAPEFVPDADLSFSMTTDGEVSVTLGEKNPIPSIVATGEVNRPTRITIAPVNCTLSGFASDPENSYCANANYNFTVADVDSIDRELASLSLLPMMVGTAGIVVSYNNGTEIISQQFVINVKAVPINVIVPTVDTCTKLITNDFTTLKPIIFRGKLEKPSTTVTMELVNCEVKNIATNPDIIYTEGGEQFTVTATSLAQLNSIFSAVEMKPINQGGTSLNFRIDGTDIYTFAFDIADEIGEGDEYTRFVQLQGNAADDTLVVGQQSDTMALVFSAVIDAGMLVTIIPNNCTITNIATAPTVVYNKTNPFNMMVTSRSELNNALANIKITPLSTENVRLDITVDDQTISIGFNNVVDA